MDLDRKLFQANRCGNARCSRSCFAPTNLKGIAAINVQEARFRNAAADNRSEQFLLDRSSFLPRTAAVAAAAAAEAEEVDRDARFPTRAIDAARQEKLLGIQIPLEFGGYGASI